MVRVAQEVLWLEKRSRLADQIQHQRRERQHKRRDPRVATIENECSRCPGEAAYLRKDRRKVTSLAKLRRKSTRRHPVEERLAPKLVDDCI